MENPEGEQRRARRVAHHYMLRVRQVDPPDPSGGWDTSTVRNISETGVFFYASRNYAAGSKLEIRMTLPIAQENCTCWGIVVRCLPSKEIKNIYEVAVYLTDIEEESREAFYENIRFFIKRGEEKK